MASFHQSDRFLMKASWPSRNNRRSVETEPRLGTPSHEIWFPKGQIIADGAYLLNPGANDPQDLRSLIQCLRKVCRYSGDHIKHYLPWVSMIQEQGHGLQYCETASDIFGCIMHCMIGFMTLTGHGYSHGYIGAQSVLKLTQPIPSGNREGAPEQTTAAPSKFGNFFQQLQGIPDMLANSGRTEEDTSAKGERNTEIGSLLGKAGVKDTSSCKAVLVLQDIKLRSVKSDLEEQIAQKKKEAEEKEAKKERRDQGLR